MTRIAHISDLHIVAPSVETKGPTMLQTIAKVIGKQRFDVEVNAKAWDRSKLDALKNALTALRPQILIVTGDVTNYGDPESFAYAFQQIEALCAASGATHVLCIPGNHDTLAERSAALGAKLGTRTLKWVASRFVEEVSAIDYVARRALRDELARETYLSLNLAAAKPPALSLPFLDGYLAALPAGWTAPDPGQPVEIRLEWGTLLFFLINSNGTDALMANEGCAGRKVLNAIDSYRVTNPKKFDESVKFALLHHHPISAPQTSVGAGERAYNWMLDGPLLLDFLDHHDFRFVLHGHEHIPFECTVNYANSPEALHIIAAGSALQGGDGGSFNVLDLASPYVAHHQRWDFGNRGFEAATDPMPLIVRTIKPYLLSSRVGSLDDVALKNLVLADVDRGNNYESLVATVEITADQLYKGSYRYTGKIITEKGGHGPAITITGSPAMVSKDMHFAGIIHPAEERVIPQLLSDNPYQKVVLVPYVTAQPLDSPFDVTLEFEWRGSNQEPHCWDGFNLGDYRGPVKTFTYEVTLGWKPTQFQVLCRGVRDYVPKYKDHGVTPLGGVKWKWGFTIENPEPVLTLINFHRPGCNHPLS
jgi:hypothetical protein